MLAAAHMLRYARQRGASVVNDALVTSIRTSHGIVREVVTNQGSIHTPIVINATGTWASEVAALAGSHIPVMPRKGFILVTEKVPLLIHHKVYDSDYVDNVASGDADLQTSTVVEGTRAGTILIGASRERIGFDRSMNLHILRRLAAQATSLFPVLRDIQLLRAYRGFRPYAPDHLPIIGEDSSISGLWHSAGHEGAGIGLAPGSAAAGRPHQVGVVSAARSSVQSTARDAPVGSRFRDPGRHGDSVQPAGAAAVARAPLRSLRPADARHFGERRGE